MKSKSTRESPIMLSKNAGIYVDWKIELKFTKIRINMIITIRPVSGFLHSMQHSQHPSSTIDSPQT